MTENVTPQPQLWLSYKCKDTNSIKIRERLESLAANKHISLVYDENGAEVGDSLIKFAQNLSASRFIVLLINEEYFCSPWTLYEFISISNIAELETRILVLMPMAESLVEIGSLIKYQEYWQENQKLRDELAELLSCESSEAWVQIESAWKLLVEEKITIKHRTINSDKMEEQLEESFLDILGFYKEALKTSENDLVLTLKRNISKIFMEWPEHLKTLCKQLNLPTNTGDSRVIKSLLDLNTKDSILEITKLVKNRPGSLSADDLWYEFLHEMEKVCGWVLLKSVEPAWWYNMELSYKQSKGDGITLRFGGSHLAYAEVMISRALLKSAKFHKNDNGMAVPGVSGDSSLTPTLFLEGVSPEAEAEENLIKLYNDLFRGNYVKQGNIDELLEELLKVVDVEKSLGEPIYYLLSHKDLSSLEKQDWFKQLNEKSKGNILFIGYGENGNTYDTQTCKTDEESLIGVVSHFLRIAYPKKLT